MANTNPNQKKSSPSSSNDTLRSETSDIASDRGSSFGVGATPSSTGIRSEEATFSDNVEHLSQEIRDRASRMASDVSERARDYYTDANDWMQQNYGKALVAVGVLAAAGLFGFFLSRRNRYGHDFEGRRFSRDEGFRPGMSGSGNISDRGQNIDRGYGSI